MPLNKKIRELQEKRGKALLGGGEQAIEKHSQRAYNDSSR
jgi:hypothetical protein